MRNAEAQIQAAVVAWVRANCPGTVIYSIPNDGLFSKSEAAKRRWTGVLAGMPDLGIVHACGAGFLEVKRPGYNPTPEQVEISETLQSLGARCAVCHSVDEARALPTGWGIYEVSKPENAA